MVRFRVSEGKRRYSVRGLFAEYEASLWDEEPRRVCAEKGVILL